MTLALVAILWAGYVVASAILASRAGRSAWAWAALAVVVGPLALLALLTRSAEGRPPRLTVNFVMLTTLGLVAAFALAGFVAVPKLVEVGPGRDTGGPGLEFAGLMFFAALGTAGGALTGAIAASLVAVARAFQLASRPPERR